jgi:crotonobetainyl-CoA:carnitine CoA-transferase CaiB-like acyl-CoA transferase
VRHWQKYLSLIDEPWAKNRHVLNLDRQWIETELGFDRLDAYQMGWLANHSRKELFKLFGENGVPYQPVHTVGEVIDSEHIAHRGFLMNLNHPTLESVRVPSLPFKLANTRSQRGPAPQLGAHNKEIYSGLLGLSNRELSAMLCNGVA